MCLFRRLSSQEILPLEKFFAPFFLPFVLMASDPNVHTTYKMEVLRDDDLRTRPLFRVTSENGEQVNLMQQMLVRNSL